MTAKSDGQLVELGFGPSLQNIHSMDVCGFWLTTKQSFPKPFVAGSIPAGGTRHRISKRICLIAPTFHGPAGIGPQPWIQKVPSSR